MARAALSLVAFAAATVAATAAIATLAACDPENKPPPKNPKAKVCPPPPEPDKQAVVVGTIGKLHMVESRYPLSRLGDVMAAFKPDLVLVAVRVDPFREGKLEDASFEMTYVAHLAKARGAATEPIDWFRDDEIGAAPPPVDPSDEVEIARREADVLAQPRLYTFEQANGAELAERVLLATNAEVRHRAGNGPWSRRTAWIQHLASNAVLRHDRPKKVLAYVDVLDRPAVEAILGGVGYEAKEPPALLAKSKEVMALGDVPGEVVEQYRAQLARVNDKREKAARPEEKAFWEERERVLSVVVDRRATCCVPRTAVGTN